MEQKTLLCNSTNKRDGNYMEDEQFLHGARIYASASHIIQALDYIFIVGPIVYAQQ